MGSTEASSVVAIRYLRIAKIQTGMLLQIAKMLETVSTYLGIDKIQMSFVFPL